MMIDALPVQKNDTVEVTFSDLSHDGFGVGKVNEYTLFVPDVLPGETAEVKVIRVKQTYGFGKKLRILKESPERIDAPCEIYGRCGGCQLQHLNYKGQLDYKRKQVSEALARIGGLEHIPVLPVLGMDEPWYYRNKAQVPVASREGELIAGFYQKRSHHIIDMNHCLIQDSVNDEVIQEVKRIARTYGVHPYDEEKHRGTLRHIVVRIGKISGELMVVLITNGHDLPFRKKFIQELSTKFPQIKSIAQNINTKRTNTIFGKETRILWGRDVIYDQIGTVKFVISPNSFYQVNPDQTHVLYEKVLEYAELNGEETVVDAYCGIGTISLFLAQRAGRVYGVEIVPEAIEDAKVNAELNGLSNVTFEVGKSEDIIPAWIEKGITPDVIVVDPPRKGCDQALLDTIIKMQPERMIYVSCNPATLARDLRILEAGGFKTERVQPVDMFSQTTHVETITLLQRRTL